MAEDYFAGARPNIESSASRQFSITPDDNVDLPIIPKALKVIGAGNLVIRDRHGTDITYPVSVGEIIQFRPVRVLALTTAVVVGWTE